MEIIDWYTEKFLQKMNGSTYKTAKEWVEGCGQNERITDQIWQQILSHPETKLK